MSLDSATDPVATALRSLLQSGLNADLAAVTTESVVAATYGWPAIAAARTPSLALPALSVWRHSEERWQRTARHVERLTTFRIDYQLPATPLERVDERWALLQLVWTQALIIIAAGCHASVSAGAPVLNNAGVVEMPIRKTPPTVAFQVPQVGESLYPTFFGQVRLVHRDTAASALADWTTLGVQIDLHDNGEATPTVPAIVEDVVPHP